MNIPGAIILFVIWWWVVFLAVLSKGVTGRWESEDDGVAGADPGAPTAPELKQKAWLATKITLVIWALTVALIASGVVNFRE